MIKVSNDSVGYINRVEKCFLNKVFYKSSACMDEVPDNSIHLIVTSPPYYNVKDYHRGEEHPEDIGEVESYEKYLGMLSRVFQESERVLTPNGKLCVNVPLMPLEKDGKKRYTREILNIPADVHCVVQKATGLKFMDMYVWERVNWTKRLMFGSYPYPPNFYAQNYCEFILVFVKEGKPPERTKEQKELSKLTKEEWVLYTSQIWKIPVPSRKDIAYHKHPAIMPEELARRLIKLYSFVGDIVLDPFAGSGTTLKVAKELGRNYVGYEIYEHFRPVIEKKLSSVVLELFNGKI